MIKKIILSLSSIFLLFTTCYTQTDNCAGATNLPVNATCVQTAFTNNENGRPEAGAPSPLCTGASPGSDVWYSVTGTGGNIQIELSGADRNGTLAIWSNCPATTQLACLPVTAGATGSIIFPTTAATTYYVQIMRQSGGDNANMSGNICATNISTAAPPNDNPCSATVLPVNASCTLTNTTNLNATNTTGVTAPGCASYSGGDVWFSVTIPASGSLNVETYANSLTDGGMAVYSGICSALTLVSCDDDSGPGLMPALTITGTPGQTFFIRFWEFGNNNNGTFGICAVAGTAPTGNQNCSTSTQICSDQSFSGNSNGYATQELTFTNQGCLSTEHQSSWYYFSPTTTGVFSMAIRPASGVDYDFAIWGPLNTLACPPSGNPLRCSFASGFSTSFESIQPSPGDYATGLSSTGNGNGNAVGPSDGTGTDILDGWVSPITIGAADVGKVYVMLIDNFTANSTPFTIDVTLGSGLTLNCNPLPIVLDDFYGYYEKGSNRLNWITWSEIDNDYFLIQRSEDGINFKNIDMIDGTGNSTETVKYSLNDPNFRRNNINYYKLIQVDFSGQQTISDPIMIDNRCFDCYLVKRTNILGQDIPENYKGLVIEIYSNGDIIKTVR